MGKSLSLNILKHSGLLCVFIVQAHITCMFQMNLWQVFTCQHLTLISQTWVMNRPNIWASAKMGRLNPATTGEGTFSHTKSDTWPFFPIWCLKDVFEIGTKPLQTPQQFCSHWRPLQSDSSYYRETVEEDLECLCHVWFLFYIFLSNNHSEFCSELKKKKKLLQ